ncbi:MAG: hypothetical protein WA639_18685 [Candidatus Acidiferrum sp.]
MDVRELISQLQQEVAERQATIKVLQDRLGIPAKKPSQSARKPHGRVYTEAQKLAMSRKLKAVLAAKRKAKAARKPKRTASKSKAAAKGTQVAS